MAFGFGVVETGFWFTAIAMLLSGIWVALAMDETLARINPADEINEYKSNKRKR